MSIYFDRTLPFYLSDSPSFDGIKVDIDDKYLKIANDLNVLIMTTENAILESSAPERSNQQLAENFVIGLEEIIDGNK